MYILTLDSNSIVVGAKEVGDTYIVGTMDIIRGSYEPNYLGYTYTDGVFSKEENTQSIRVITTGSMQTRFSITEEVTITDGTDSVAKVLLARLLNAKNINLDLPEFTESLAYIVNFLDVSGVLYLGATPSERTDQLLVDGTEEEKYIGA